MIRKPPITFAFAMSRVVHYEVTNIQPVKQAAYDDNYILPPVRKVYTGMSVHTFLVSSQQWFHLYAI